MVIEVEITVKVHIPHEISSDFRYNITMKKEKLYKNTGFNLSGRTSHKISH